MDFRGRAKRIEDIDLPRIGAIIGVGEDVIHAVIDVESSGSGFDSSGRPKMLFEPHIFYRQLPTVLRTEAYRRGLAYRSWGEQPYPKDSYPRLKKAMELHEIAALRSASWALGQIMGFNHVAAGYETVKDMITAFMDDEDNHLEAMIQFIVTNELDDDLRALQAARTWNEQVQAAAGFARVYNGSGYERHNYHIRIAKRYVWWKGKPDTPWNPVDSVKEEMEPHVQVHWFWSLLDNVLGYFKKEK